MEHYANWILTTLSEITSTNSVGVLLLVISGDTLSSSNTTQTLIVGAMAPDR